jgi:fibronectin type 3 domain-containing protein
VKKASTRISTPQINSLTLASYRKISVKWEKIKGVTGYRIYRKSGKSGTYKFIKEIKGANTVRYVDDEVMPNSTYHYKLRAYKTVHGKKYYSPYSKEKKKSSRLAAPALVSVSLSGNNGITLSWKQEKWIGGYQICRADSAKGKYKTIRTISGKKHHRYTDKTLTANGAYYYKIRTYVTVKGNKKYSAYSNVIVGKTKLAQPAIRSANVLSPTKTKLSWKKTDGAHGYQVYRSTSYKGKYTKVKTIQKGNTLSCTDTNLIPNKIYFYKIRAYNTVHKTTKYSKFSSVICVTPRLEEPKIKSVTKISANRVKISWKKADGAQGYRLYRASSKKGSYKPVRTTTGSSFTDTGLSKGKTYYYKVRAYVKVSGVYRYSTYSDTWSVQTRK